MEKEFIPYEQALELKELGFKYGCQRFYNKNKKLKWSFANGLGQEYFNQSDAVAAPLYQQAFRWFREKHEYYTDLFVDDNKTFGFCVTYVSYTERIDKPIQRYFNTYEEAELACLKKLIEIVKTDNSATEDWPIHSSIRDRLDIYI